MAPHIVENGTKEGKIGCFECGKLLRMDEVKEFTRTLANGEKVTRLVCWSCKERLEGEARKTGPKPQSY